MNAHFSSSSVPSSVPSSAAAVPGLVRELRRPVDVDVLARRMGRIAFGIGFLIGPTVVVSPHAMHAFQLKHVVVPLLIAGWCCAALTSVIVTRLARSWLSHGDGRTGDALLRASLIVPGVLLAVVGPISLHAPIAFLIGGAKAVDEWAGFSLAVTALAHAVLVILVVMRALRLAAGEKAMTTAQIYWLVVAASGMPGAIALGIPVLVTAITGIAAWPLLERMQGIVDEERRQLMD